VVSLSDAIGERSSRRIERRCVEDVATRVICANQAPDHTTISRFRQRHEAALASLFGEVLLLCAEAGLVQVGVIATVHYVAGQFGHGAEQTLRTYGHVIAEYEDGLRIDAEMEIRDRARAGRTRHVPTSVSA
jgi:hypothetical protein